MTISNQSLEESLQDSVLGKTTVYPETYSSKYLYAIPRLEQRKELGIETTLPFYGHDVWNGYEVSWLNAKGKPIVATCEIIIPCASPCLIESKSLKLYFNSFNNTRFSDCTKVLGTITKDLSTAAQLAVQVNLRETRNWQASTFSDKTANCLDELDVETNNYTVDSSLLTTTQEIVTENLCSHLLKSNCPITGQPDWATLYIQYSGKKIVHEPLLKYIISFRDHNEFHEHCVERIFLDLMRYCQPQLLTVFARYTRRGGFDINPYRSSEPLTTILNQREFRQ
jgi:7-cyano-7-deazaguanine reductase